MRNEADLNNYLKGKKVLYIATKNLDYIRVNQEIEIIKNKASYTNVIASQNKKYFKRIVDVAKELLKVQSKEYDIIFVGFMAQMIFLLFPWKFRKNIVITDFFISIYDTLVFDRKRIKKDSILAKFCKMIDIYTVKKSDYLVADTKTHASYFAEEFNANEKNIFVCYLKADKNIYYPRLVEKPEEYKDKYVVLYFGSILPVQGVDVVMEAIQYLNKEKSIQFIIIGPTNKNFSRVELDTVTYIEWLSQETLSEYIAFSDLCLAGHFSATVNKANRTIPGKAYIYQAMKKEMILGTSEANKELFDETYSFVSRGDSKELARCIREHYKKWKLG